MNAQQAEKILEKQGYRLIGRDPYHNYTWHIAKWTDDTETCSYTVGWTNTLQQAIDMINDDYEGYADEDEYIF